MADRYWVGGTANWDGTAGTKWATTSGGLGGASVPTSADDVFFTNLSTGTCTISAGNTGAKSINCTGFTGTLAGTAGITVSGSVTLVAGMTVTYSGTLTLNATGTLTSGGKTLGPVTISGSGITVTLGDALTSSDALTITQGTFTTNNYNVTATSLSSTNTNTRTINLGSSTVTLNGGGFGAQTSTNLTFNAGTSTIVLSNTAVNLNFGLTAGPGGTFYNVSFTSTSVLTYSVGGPNTFNNLTVTAPSAAGVTQVTFNAPQTINGTLSTTGTAGNRRVWFRGVTYGIAQTLTINATPSLTDADFRDIYVVGTAAPISGTRIGNLRGCRGITFSTPKTVYWNLAGAQNWSANGWSDTSTGTPNTNFFPLAQDTATFTNAGSVTGAITISADIPYTGTVDMSGRTSAMTLNVNTTTVYGDWTNGSGSTVSGTALVFSGRNVQTITSAGKTLICGITVDSYGGTVQLADAINTSNLDFTITNGTWDTKNYSVTTNALNSNNSNVRTITLGSSTVTITNGTGLGSVIVFSTSTNLTLNSGTSQINIGGTSGTVIQGGGLTFYNLSYTVTAAVVQSIQGANTFNNLTLTAPASTGFVTLSLTANQTINGTLTVAGASPIRRIFVRSNTLGTTRTLTVGTLSATDCDFRDITIAGTAAGSSPTRAGDCGGNSGITFPAPKTVYWNLAGTQNWSATAWAPGSGGTPNINNFPLAQDTAVFDNTGSVGTVTTDASWALPTINMSARTSAMTFSIGTVNPIFIYGDFTFGTGVTTLDSSGILRFGKRGVQTITSNGRQFNFDVYVDSVTGTVQLADAIVNAAGRQIGLTSGTFDAGSYNVTTGFVNFSGSTTRTLKMGSGTWTVSGAGAIWEATTTTNLAFYKGTANIVLSDTSTSARTFNGGALSYNKLTIGGTTGTSTLTITGNNQFTELASTKTVAHTIALGSTTQTFGKWTVTGTVGNVVTVTGSASLTIAGACTSGLDYLALGTTTVSASSPGEFYAGANSTATGATAPLYLTAKPADSTRYWVGGTGNWSDTARWSTGSGGAGGASVPRSHDDVVFDSLSNATAYTATVNAVTGGIRMKSLTIAGPASGNVTLAGSANMVGIHGNVTLPATGLTRTYTGGITLSSNSTGLTFTTNGVTLASAITVNGVDCSWSLGSALSNSTTNDFTVTNGTFDFASYTSSPGGGIISTTQNARSINFGSSTLTLIWIAPINFGTSESQRANLTVTAGTSQIICTQNSTTLSGNNQTFYNVSFTGHFPGFNKTINGANTFNNLSFTGSFVGTGLVILDLAGSQTVTGTLTFAAGTNATMRYFCRSSTLGTTRTLTVAAFSGTDVDFRDITVTGAAAPISGTRLGDCKGNSGITFVAGKTVYVRSTGNANWSSSTGWSATSGGTADVTQFPLAQDTVIFPAATYPASGSTITIDISYNIGTVDMSLRTSNTVTLACSQSPTIYGNWINGTGTSLSGASSTATFSGRSSQTITNAGITFPYRLTIDSPGGSVTLQDAFTGSFSSSDAFLFTRGTFDAATYNVTNNSGGTGGGISSSNSNVRTIAIGSGTWSTTGGWDTATSTNLTVTGTGTISLTSASAKTFAGGGAAYTNITLNQGGAGALTITGNNTFKDITNTYKATGATNITLGTTTQRVSQFTAAGEAGRLLTIQGTSATSPATLVFTGSGTAANVDYLVITGVRAYNLVDTWYAGANSTNNGSLGWYFQSGGTTISASVSETSTALDSILTLGSFGSAVSETITASDSIFGGLLFLRDIAETATGSDSISSAVFINRFVDESASALDTLTTIATLNPAITEFVVGADVVSSLGTFGSSLSEVATGQDTFSAIKLLESFISEASSVSDTVAVTLTIALSINETASIQDVVTTLATLNASASETVTAADSDVGFITFPTSINETSTASETFAAAALFAPIIIESASSTDTIASSATFGSLVNELTQALDTFLVAASIFNAPFSDSVTASDSDVGFLTLPATISESATGTDTDVGFITFPASINETSTAFETMAAQAVFKSSITESGLALDAVAVAPSVFNVVVPESAVAQDLISTSAIFLTSFADTVTVLDLAVGAFLWNLIDDAQPGNWQNIATNTASGWQVVNTQQAGNWQNINTTNAGGWTTLDTSAGSGWVNIDTI